MSSKKFCHFKHLNTIFELLVLNNFQGPSPSTPLVHLPQAPQAEEGKHKNYCNTGKLFLHHSGESLEEEERKPDDDIVYSFFVSLIRFALNRMLLEKIW